MYAVTLVFCFVMGDVKTSHRNGLISYEAMSERWQTHHSNIFFLFIYKQD